LAERLISAGVEREVRGREHASDHAPAWIELAEPTKASPARPVSATRELTMTATHRFDLERFVTAQAPVFETALAELRAGRKRTHWMWFVFPQLAGLGRSSTARFYGIGSPDEARAYLAHPVLGPRLELCTRTVLASESPSLHAIFGSPDDLKFRSCMTLFSRAADDPDNPFRQALDRWCNGQPDEQTLDLIDAGG
jgi:uncharacterized protein (DUF1810 family)